MSDGIEALLRLQKGWKESEALPEQKHPVLFRQKRLFRSMAAAVLREVYDGFMTASDEVLPTQVLEDYIRSVQAHFGTENCRRVAIFHGLTGSTYREDRAGFITHLDFPGAFSLFGVGGFWDRMRGFNSALPSSSPEPQASVSHTPASPQTESEAQ